MKIKLNQTPQGNALIMTLLIALTLGSVLASYLNLVSQQNLTVMRSLAWNSAVGVCESGVEEALTHLHYRGITNLLTDGWTSRIETDGVYYDKSRKIGGGCSYDVSIKAVLRPEISSTGHVPAPLTPSSPLAAIFAQTYGGSPSQSGGIVSRSVKVTAAKYALFAKGMVAKGQINLNGNNIRTDSFDSSDPNYSTGGNYDATKSKDNGDVATNSGLVNSLSVGNADIMGHVSTGPGGSVSVGANGSVGSKAWVEGGNSGIEPGYSSDDMNVQFNGVTLPPVTWTSLSPAPTLDPLSGITYDYVISSGNWRISNFTGKVLVTGDATVHVTDSYSFTGNDIVRLASGAKLTVYNGASTAKIAGNGVINPGSALNYSYKGLASNTSVAYSGNAAFTGTIYAPDADFALGGGGSNTYDFVGASITKSVTMNGHFNFHYDEFLAKQPDGADYVVQSWHEM